MNQQHKDAVSPNLFAAMETVKAGDKFLAACKRTTARIDKGDKIRIIVARALCFHMEFAVRILKAIVRLCEVEEQETSAAVLYRALYESVIMGIWIAYPADDKARFRRAQSFFVRQRLSYDVLAAAISGVPGGNIKDGKIIKKINDKYGSDSYCLGITATNGILADIKSDARKKSAENVYNFCSMVAHGRIILLPPKKWAESILIDAACSFRALASKSVPIVNVPVKEFEILHFGAASQAINLAIFCGK